MRLYVGDTIYHNSIRWSNSWARVECIEINRDGLRDGVEVADIDVDRVIDKDVRLTLDNGHWINGYQFIRICNEWENE